MIGWNKAKSSKQPHVPLKQLSKQLVDLSKIIEKRAPQAEKIKAKFKSKDKQDDWWRKQNKVPYSVLQKRAGRLSDIIGERAKNAKAWNGKAW